MRVKIHEGGCLETAEFGTAPWQGCRGWNDKSQVERMGAQGRQEAVSCRKGAGMEGPWRSHPEDGGLAGACTWGHSELGPQLVGAVGTVVHPSHTCALPVPVSSDPLYPIREAPSKHLQIQVPRKPRPGADLTPPTEPLRLIIPVLCSPEPSIP